MERPCLVCKKPVDQFDFVYLSGGEVDSITPYLSGDRLGHVKFKRLKRLWICPGCWEQIPFD